MEWRSARWSVCLPLLILPCTVKSRSSLLAPAHLGGPGKRAVKRLWCGGSFLFIHQVIKIPRIKNRKKECWMAISVLCWLSDCGTKAPNWSAVSPRKCVEISMNSPCFQGSHHISHCASKDMRAVPLGILPKIRSTVATPQLNIR